MIYSTRTPVITYRHLVSAGTLNAANPLRVVSLCDIDAAYAAFEAKRLEIDPFVTPIAVQQWQGLIAIGYAARKHGITRHETVDEAKKKCRDIVLVHVATYAEGSETAQYNDNPRPETHKVSLDPYRRESRKVVAIFNEMCPLGAIEKASIDEMYCDLTLAVRQLILQRFPHLARPPADSPHGLDTPLPAAPSVDWTNLGHRLPTTPKESSPDPRDPSAQSEGEATLPSTLQVVPTWTDYALACGAELIFKIRAEVRNRLGYTMSAGVAPNKTLAKLSASEHKPNGQTTMLPAAIPIYLKDLPVSKIRFLGGKLGRAIEAEWRSSTTGELWSVSLEEMQQKFGEESRWVYDVLRGIDNSAVIERTKNKTMLASKNVVPPIKTTKEARKWLSILSNELCVRLKEAREESTSLWPSTLTLRYLRRPDAGGSAEAHSHQSSFPFVKDLRPQNISTAAEKLWIEVFGDNEHFDAEVITIALGFSGLETGEQGQRSLHGFFGKSKGAGAKRQTKGDSNSDFVASSGTRRSSPSMSSLFRLGETGGPAPAHPTQSQMPGLSQPPSLSMPPLNDGQKKNKFKPNGLELLFRKDASSATATTISVPGSDQSSASPAGLTANGAEADDGNAGGPVWVCPTCSRRIQPRPALMTCTDGTAKSVGLDEARKTSKVGGEAGEEDTVRRLRLARQDHEDYHFALDLETEEKGRRAQAMMPRGSLPSQNQSSSQGSKRATGSYADSPSSVKKPKGLQSFFTKKTRG